MVHGSMPGSSHLGDDDDLATLNRFFECRMVVFGLLKLNIKARHDIPEFLTANFSSKHLIAWDID